MGVVARNQTTQETGSTTVQYQLTTRLVNGLANVGSTRHPLVAYFSAPACLNPNSMHIVFFRPFMYDATVQTTGLAPCRAIVGTPQPDLTSMNFHVAGMYPSTEYLMRFEVLGPNGTIIPLDQALAPTGAPINFGRTISFTTAAIPAGTPLPSFVVTLAPPPGHSDQQMLLHAWNNRNVPVLQTATDLAGNPMWYYQGTVDHDRVYRPGWGGTVMMLHSEANANDSTLREIDLAGNTLVETSVGRVSEQLVSMGFERIVDFNHDVSRIFNPGHPNHGYILLIGGTHLISTNHQGGTPQNPVDIVADHIIVLDRNLQVAWAWSPFVHLDLDRLAVLGETCTPTGQCKPLSGFSVANDWIHTNSARYTSWDGNILVSLRHQDWVIKIKYTDGTGDGSVLWRMGAGGISASPPKQPRPRRTSDSLGSRISTMPSSTSAEPCSVTGG